LHSILYNVIIITTIITLTITPSLPPPSLLLRYSGGWANDKKEGFGANFYKGGDKYEGYGSQFMLTRRH